VEVLKMGAKCLWKVVSEDETTDGEGIRQAMREDRGFKGSSEQAKRCLECNGYNVKCFRYKSYEERK
jgi:hypothetical protein